MENNKQIYQTYRYILVGSQGVGKTNLITRFIRDEFVDSHNLILQGEQTVVFTIKQTRFQLLFQDKRNITEMIKIDLKSLEEVDGIMFVFSYDQEDSYQNIVKQLEYMKDIVRPYLDRLSKKLASIMVGNKSDLGIPLLEMGDTAGELRFTTRVSIHDKALRLSQKFNIKYFDVSSKCSPRKDIEHLFMQLINENQIYKFQKDGKKERSVMSKMMPRMPCCGRQQDSGCNIS